MYAIRSYYGEGILGAHGAAGFHLDPVTALLCLFLDGFGGHEGVGHTCGAGGDGDDALHPSYNFV